jgi:Actin
MRQVLMGNVVLAGGGSLFAGLGERLNIELVRNFPHVKIHAPGNPAERRYGSWLGGSILASLGTFHQLWISREEWQVSLAPCSAGNESTDGSALTFKFSNPGAWQAYRCSTM